MKNQTSYKSNFTVNPALSSTQTLHLPILHNHKQGFQLKNLDRMGEPIPFHWNGDDVYRTKLGVIPTACAYLILSWIIYYYMREFSNPGSPNISSRRVYEVPTKSDPINLSKEVMFS